VTTLASPPLAATERLWAAVETYDGEVADTTLADLMWSRSLDQAVT
jgi:MerR family transcriptional regulator, light-induced transcriptional regulator